MAVAIIYSISEPITKTVIYVGKTVNPDRRKQEHLTNSHNPLLREKIKAIRELGYEPIFEILQECDDLSFSEIEKKWIHYFRELGFKLFNVDTSDKDRIIKPRKQGISIIHVYLPDDKFAKLRQIGEDKRQPLTRLIEGEIDKLIKREGAV